jgi:hypothetical protein
MKHVSGAIGAAIVAASRTYFSSIIEATASLTQLEKEILPNAGLSVPYNDNYHRFINTLNEMGLLAACRYA